MVKLDFETLPTVPEDPLRPVQTVHWIPPPPPGAPTGRLLDAGCAADAEGEVARPTESPIMGANSEVATMLRHFFFVCNRRTFGLRGCIAAVVPTDQFSGVAGG
jgi:hypothetical protein